jgi:hypothetical protein
MIEKELWKKGKRVSGEECLGRDMGSQLNVSWRHISTPMSNRIMDTLQ